MSLIGGVRREWDYLSGMLRVLGRYKAVARQPNRLVPDLLAECAARWPDNIALIDDDLSWTFAEMEAYANRVANWALNIGMGRGETVALFMRNRPQYLAIWYGLSKAGIIPALLNNQLSGASLEHCIAISGARRAIVEPDLAETLQRTAPGLEIWSACGPHPGVRDFDRALRSAGTQPPGRDRLTGTTISDLFMIMFTSGTTGLPKVARMTHSRALGYLTIFTAAARTSEADRMMMVLPMYHATGGLCGVGAALTVGGAVIVRREFSASAFWHDAARFGATMFMYVGELCRFLMAQPESEAERNHSIRVAIGNGLRADVWTRLKQRTGIAAIVEFYGATEGNVGLMNINGPPGSIGRVAPYLAFLFNVALIRHDVESGAAVRDAKGFCIRTRPGEVGEAIGEIRKNDPRYRFEGYHDKAETEKKILRDVFRKGDAWFRTGDLMRRDELGYYYFIDRVGDTYRWKAENVATGQVEEALSVFPGIEEAIVYGVTVPGYEGRAGMAMIVAPKKLDLEALAAHLKAELPPQAVPVFLRFARATPTTGTFKYQKTTLKADGFDLERISQPMMYLTETGQYEDLTPEIYARIQSGEIRF